MPHDESAQPAVAKEEDTIADSDLRARIATIWQAALGMPHVGYEDNFFDLGGQSLLALQIIGQINNVFGCSVQPADLVASPTIAALAAHVEQQLLGSAESSELDALLAELRELPEKDALASLNRR